MMVARTEALVTGILDIFSVEYSKDDGISYCSFTIVNGLINNVEYVIVTIDLIGTTNKSKFFCGLINFFVAREKTLRQGRFCLRL